MDHSAVKNTIDSAELLKGVSIPGINRGPSVVKTPHLRAVEIGEQQLRRDDEIYFDNPRFEDALNNLARNAIRIADDIPRLVQITTSTVVKALGIERVIVLMKSTDEENVKCDDVSDIDGDHKETNVAFPTRMDVTIGAGDYQLGILRCESDDIEHTWTEKERAFTASVADILRVALEAQRSRKYQCELETALAEAKAAVRSKSEFLANISHELRTPLNGVLGMAQILCDAPLSKNEKQLVDIIMSSGCALLSQVDDLISMADDEQNAGFATSTEFYLKDVIQSSIDSVAAAAISKDINISLIFDESLNEPFVGDGARIRKTLTNLVDNAVKFTESGVVTIAAEPAAHGRTRFSVTDTGNGISLDKQQVIFDEFTQADGSRSRPQCGMGIGLALAQKYVRCMGGEILVISTVGKGATFSFELELTKARECRLSPATNSAAPEYGDLSGKRILIADSHPVSRMIMDAALSGEGASLTLVEDGQAVIEEAQSAKYDLILMDAELPLVSVTKVVAEFRDAKAASVATPIVIIANDQDQGRKIVSAQNDMIDYLVKPISVPQLYETVQRYCID